MKQSNVLWGITCALVALPLFATGCKKKEPAATGSVTATATGAGTATATGAGTATATGAGTATAAGTGDATGTAAPTEQAAPWAADTAPQAASSKVTGKRSGNDEGTFDRALYFKGTDKWGSVRHRVLISTSCEKFACSHVDWIRGGIYTNDEKLAADCPSAKVMTVDLNVGDGDPKPGELGVSISINGFSSGGSLSGEEWNQGSSLTAVSDKEITGKIAIKDGDSAANGDFTAKVCGVAADPKQP